MACNWFGAGRKRQQEKAQPPQPLPVPDPTSRQPIRVTDDRDGELLNRGYAYWPQAWIGANGLIHLFVGHADGHPRFFTVTVQTGEIVRLGPLLDQFGYVGTGEGLYFDKAGWIYFCDGPRLRRVNPFTGQHEVVFSIEDTHSGCRIFQAHSSDDGQAHNATVQQIVESGPYPNLGTVIWRTGQAAGVTFGPEGGSFEGRQDYYPADTYDLDESQLAGTRYLLIKSSPDDDNLVIDLETGEQRPWWRKADGSVGHSDCGDGFVVGADRAHGTCVRVNLSQQHPQGIPLYESWSIGHIAVKGQTCISSDSTHINRVALSGWITPLIKHGMVNPYPPDDPRSYDYQVFGNISPDESTIMFMSNKEGRMDAYVLEIQ